MAQSIEIGKQVLKKLESCGYEAYFIGGSSRDQLLNNVVEDIDVTTNARPDEIILALNEFKIANKDGIFYGTVKYKIEGIDVEITSFRKEGIYIGSRRPMKVEFINDKFVDSLRRDFTINALYMDYKGNVIDFHEGLKDLNNKIIKTIGNPDVRFKEDALRILRAIRFSLTLNFDLDLETKEAIKKNSYLLNDLKENVIKKELNKIKKLKNNEELAKIFLELNIKEDDKAWID